MSCTINDYNSYVVVGGQTVYIGGGAGTLAGVTAAPGSSITASVNVNFSSSMSTGDFTGYRIGFYDNNAGNLPSITSPQVPWLDDATFTLYLTMPPSGDLEGMFMVLDTNYNTLCEGGAFRVVSTGTSQVIANQCDAFGSCPASNDGASCCNTDDGYEYVCHTQSNGGYSWNPGAQCSGVNQCDAFGSCPASNDGASCCNTDDGYEYVCHTQSNGGYSWNPGAQCSGGDGTTTNPTCATGYTYNDSTKLCVQNNGGGSVSPTACPTGYTYNASTKVCVQNVTTTTGNGGTTTVQCVGMNRSGSFDPTCALQTGNEMYLYGAAAVIIAVLLLRR